WMASPRSLYLVSRPLYTEDSLAEKHEKVCRDRKTLSQHVLQYFKWDTKRAKKAGLSLLPIIGWMRIYQIKSWLLGDIVSGVSTGLVAVMQGLAFAMLASLPPEYGLYTAFFPMITYFFLGTSRHISVGAFPVLSLMVSAVVTTMVPEKGDAVDIPGFDGKDKEQKRVLVASSMTFLVGMYQLGMGLLQVGFVVRYLSDTLVSGFTTAAAVHILVSQLKFILGLEVTSFNGVLEIFVKIGDTNLCDLVTSLLIIGMVFVYKEVNDTYKDKLPVPIPIEVIMTVIACGVSYGLDFEKRYQITVVGEMKRGYEAPIAPDIDVMKASAMEAFPVAIVGFAVAYSVAKVYSVKHDYTIDGNQELIAFGVSNMFGASFKSFAASTALSRTAIQESSGGKTQVAGLVAAMMAMLVTLALGFLLAPLPKSVLGALVVVNLKGMLMQFSILPSLWRKDKLDLVVWVVTCLASILLGLDLGLGVGLGVELLTVVFRTQLYVHTSWSTLWLGLRGPCSRDQVRRKGVVIFKIPSPIFFANVDFFREKLNDAVGFNPLKVLRKRNKAERKMKDASIWASRHEGDVVATWPDMHADEPEQPMQIDWKGNLPSNVSVPRVDLHSLILDFSAVTFLDIAGITGLKMVVKEFIRLRVDVYIVSCDECILEKLHRCAFFDDDVSRSIFYPSLHDATLSVLESQKGAHPPGSVVRNEQLDLLSRLNKEQQLDIDRFSDEGLVPTVGCVCVFQLAVSRL
uniref:Solute carrier family 26 member 3 n=1 Tax=Gadus morhua TaxID=8049 RepID=A0A8C5CV30_GADMO